MKIGILTFHRCINYGSYWQARCLVEGLRRQGHDAELLDHDSTDVRRAEWRCTFQPVLPQRTPRADYPRYAAKARRFLRALGELPRSPPFPLEQPQEAGRYDLILIGSDEVWNFRHPWYGSKPIFFGDGLHADRLASYAASFGNHDARDGIHPEWAGKLARFASISIRDENSRQLVRQGLNVDPVLVLDPCLQFPPHDTSVPNAERPYLALYGHSFPDWFAHRIRDYARERRLPIISIGYRNDWADEQWIELDPVAFSRGIAAAHAVATNFFHGCVFALHHQRPFVSTPSTYRFNKIRDLAHALKAQDHLVTEKTPGGHYAALLDSPLDPAIGERIAALRARSSAFLASVLG